MCLRFIASLPFRRLMLLTVSEGEKGKRLETVNTLPQRQRALSSPAKILREAFLAWVGDDNADAVEIVSFLLSIVLFASDWFPSGRK